MPLARPWLRRVVGLGLCAVFALVLLSQVGFGANPATTAKPTASGATIATPSQTPAQPSPSATTVARATATPNLNYAAWQPDPALVDAKNTGRVAIDGSGGVVILDAAPTPPVYPKSATLDTSWIRFIQEPPQTGKDDKGTAYFDKNYALLCGPGSAAVVLYYWPSCHGLVTTKTGTYVEPVTLAADNRHAATYWNATGAAGYGRGMIMYLADVEWPTPDKGDLWWASAGLLNWAAVPPSTNRENLTDAINWEASGRSRLSYFYTIVPASQLTAAALLAHVQADIAMGVPVVIAARTSDGSHSLPFWKVRTTKSAVNHFVTVVGYDDKAHTYSVMDTCGLTCNDRRIRGGLGTMSQAALYSLIKAESDDDGIIW